MIGVINVKRSIGVITLVMVVITVIVFAVSAENTRTPKEIPESENNDFTREKLNEIISKSGVSLNLVNDNGSDISYGDVFLFTDYDKCVENNTEPSLHDLSTVEDVKTHIGVPTYEEDNVLIYSNLMWLFAFEDGKLSKLAWMSNNNDDFVYVKDIFDAINLEKVRNGIEEKIQEEKEFREKRDAILNSDDELYKLTKMTKDEVLNLIGGIDYFNEYLSMPSPGYYITKERKVSIEFDKDKVVRCYRVSNSGEQLLIFLESEWNNPYLKIDSKLEVYEPKE